MANYRGHPWRTPGVPGGGGSRKTRKIRKPIIIFNEMTVNETEKTIASWNSIHAFLLAMDFLGPGSNYAKQISSKIPENWPYPKISLTLSDKKVFKMLIRKSAIIWERSWSLVFNIFRDRFWKLTNLSLALLIKKACNTREDLNFINMTATMRFNRIKRTI